MPPGIPVATMAINGAKNAGLFAAKILATSNSDIIVRLAKYTETMEKQVLEKADKLEQLGFKDYLENSL